MLILMRRCDVLAPCTMTEANCALSTRREALDAKDEQRSARVLHSWDFLLGVQDFTRQGALRFRTVPTTHG